jgi:eukaryotic-like serine/threonine-protein kinase
VSDRRGSFLGPRLFPDAQHQTHTVGGANQDIWIQSPERGTFTRLTLTGSEEFDAVWTADGKRVAYSSERLGRAPAIYWKPSDGSGEEEELTHGDYPRFVQDASRDGKLLAFTELNPETGWDIWVLPLEGSRQPVPFLRTPFAEAEPTFSPDGRWLACTSNESGRFEVYARPYPGPGIKVQISTAGGVEPLWSKDGRELFYRSGQRVMSASVRLSPELTAGTPQVLFESPSPYDTDPEFRQYDVAADGRFLMIREMAGPRPPDHLRLVVGWRPDLARRVPN